MPEKQPKKFKWTGSDLTPFFALVSKLGSDNVDIVLDVETGLLWVYEESESEAKPGGTPFNYAHKCPPEPDEMCET